MQDYAISILGLLALSVVTLALAGIVGPAKGKAGLRAGEAPKPDYSDPLFRLDRAHLNSVENLSVFAVPVFCAMLVGVGPTALAVMVWLQVGLRLLYSLLYMRGVGISAGGPRTFVFIGSSVLTLVLIIWVAVAALR